MLLMFRGTSRRHESLIPPLMSVCFSVESSNPRQTYARSRGTIPMGALVYICVCIQVGGRSVKACATLSEHGVPASRLFNMEGGIIRWAQEVDGSLAVY